MNSFYSQTNRAVQRAHASFAHSFTVHSYTWDDSGGTNAYASGSWTESTVSVEGTIRTPEQPKELAGPDGNDVAVDVEIYVQPEDVDVELGHQDESRATEFTDSGTGARYRAINVRNQNSLLAIDCEEL